MGSFIFLIFIGIFIYKIVKAAEKSNPKNLGRPNQQRVQQSQVQPQTYQSKQRQPQQNAYYYNEQQRATKQRLQQKYGQNTNMARQAKGDILSRAKENVLENEPDKVAQELHAEVCRDYREQAAAKPDVQVHMEQSHDGEPYGESDILKRVNDLMVTGYSGEMKFERDFIAEGVEMLNGFGI